MTLFSPEKFTDLAGSDAFTFPTDGLEFEIRRSVRTSTVPIQGSSSEYNYWRGVLPPLGLYDITIRFLDFKTDADAIDDEIENVYSKVMRAGKLWFKRNDNTRRYIIAQPEELPRLSIGPRQVRHVPYVLKFLGFGDMRDESLTSGTESGISSSPHTWTITNPGNQTVTDAIFTLTALSNNGFTADVVLENLTTGESITIDRSSVATNDELVIDCGKGTVKFNGSDDFSNVTFGSTQRLMMSLLAGDNSMRLTIAGTPDADLDYSFRGAWF